VQGNHTLLLIHGTGANTTKLLHVSANTEQKTQVNTESTDISTSLTADPENTEVTVIVKLVEVALVDGTDTQLTLDGGDQGRTLEESTGEGLQSTTELSLATGDLVVETDNANVLLTSTLLGLDQTSSTVNADDQAASDLGIKGTGVTSLLGSRIDERVRLAIFSQCFRAWGSRNIGLGLGSVLPEDPLHPSHDFVTGGVGRLVQVDNTGADVGLQVTLKRRSTSRDRGEVTGANEHCAGRKKLDVSITPGERGKKSSKDAHFS